MARRSDHTREELRELILQAGEALLDEGGLAAFGARKVAARIGYTVGTLYHVFGSYDAMVLHINARTLDHWYGEMEAAVQAGPERAVHALAEAYIRYSRQHYYRWVTLFEHHMPGEEPLPDWYAPKLSRFFTLLEKAVQPMLKGTQADPKHAARILWTGIHGIAILSATHKLDLVTQASAEALAQEAVDSYLAGIRRL